MAAATAGERPPVPSTRLPSPLPPLTAPPIDVGTYPARSVEAEDFARRIGNWGSAARDIGDRWEDVGLARLRARLPWTLLVGGGRAMRVERIVRLDSGAAGTALQRAGVSAPDLVLLGTVGTGSGPRAAVRAADLKVSLDTAERAQTAPARLQAAFARVGASMPTVRDAILAEAAAQDDGEAIALPAVQRALSGDWDGIVLVEGVFVAPDTGFNRWFLQAIVERRRRGGSGPRLPFRGRRHDVDGGDGTGLGLPAHLEPVAAADFLGDLAGWVEAAVVASLDGIDLDAVDPAIAERCWRVGNGLRGALLAIRRRLFEPPWEVRDASGRPANVARVLRDVGARERGRSGGLVRHVADAVDRRRPAWEEEARTLAFPVGFETWARWYAAARSMDGPPGDIEAGLAANLASAGIEFGPPDDDSEEGVRRRFVRECRAAHRTAAQRHRGRVIASAREAYARGLGEAATLELVRSRIADWVDAARADASSEDPGGDLPPPADA